MRSGAIARCCHRSARRPAIRRRSLARLASGRGRADQSRRARRRRARAAPLDVLGPVEPARRSDLRHPHPRGPRRAVAAGLHGVRRCRLHPPRRRHPRARTCSTSSPRWRRCGRPAATARTARPGGRSPPTTTGCGYSWLLDLAGVRVGLTHDVPMPELPPNFTVERWKLRRFGTTGHRRARLRRQPRRAHRRRRADAVRQPRLADVPAQPEHPARHARLPRHRRRRASGRRSGSSPTTASSGPTAELEVPRADGRRTTTCSSRPTGRSPRSR